MPRTATTKKRENKNMASVTLTDEQFRALLAQLQASTNDGRQNAPSPAPSVHGGNFIKCTSRFDAAEGADVEAFISAVETFKDCANVSDETALKGLPILLTNLAATWWLGVKTTIETWDEALDALRKAFGKKKPPYQLYIELFSLIHEDQSNTDVFVCRARAIFADIPDKLDEKVQLDMVYGLLNRRIRKRIPRDDITTFSDLLDKARAVEQTLAEVSKRKEEKPPKEDKVSSEKPRCNYCQNIGHLVSDCKKLLQRKPLTCYGCGAPGVIRSKCPECNKPPKPTNVNSTAVSEPVEFNIVQQRITAERPLLQIEINNRKGISTVRSLLLQTLALSCTAVLGAVQCSLPRAHCTSSACTVQVERTNLIIAVPPPGPCCLYTVKLASFSLSPALR